MRNGIVAISKEEILVTANVDRIGRLRIAEETIDSILAHRYDPLAKNAVEIGPSELLYHYDFGDPDFVAALQLLYTGKWTIRTEKRMRGPYEWDYLIFS
jgi:hypothetical protein